MNSFKERLTQLCGTSSKLKVHPKSNSDKCWSLRYASKDTKKLAEFMYKDSTIFLLRKLERFKQGDLL